MATLSLCSTLDVPEPSYWPISLKKYGTNPAGKPVYRIVFAPTVQKLIFGTNGKGETGAHVRPAYRHLGPVWIMEKWISGQQATQMTPSEYERMGPRDPQSGMLIEGPYPYNGVYHHCWTFDAEGIVGVEQIIGLIKKGEGRSLAEIQAKNKELDEKEEKRQAEERFMRVRETEPLYGTRAASFAGQPKAANHKTFRNPITANELARGGMPFKRGAIMSRKGRTVEWPSMTQP